MNHQTKAIQRLDGATTWQIKCWDRGTSERVIIEDHYISYLTGSKILPYFHVVHAWLFFLIKYNFLTLWCLEIWLFLINTTLFFSDEPPKGKQLVHIYYSSLNFRDVMMMTGKLAPEIMYTERMDQASTLF